VTRRREKPGCENRLEKIGDVIDELDRKLDAVEFLDDAIVDKPALQTAEDLAGKARAALIGVRDVISGNGAASTKTSCTHQHYSGAPNHEGIGEWHFLCTDCGHEWHAIWG
jgi:hypothetical protein